MPFVLIQKMHKGYDLFPSEYSFKYFTRLQSACSYTYIHTHVQHTHIHTYLYTYIIQLLDKTEQNIVIYQWRADQLFADAEGRGIQLISEPLMNHDILR